VSIFDRISKNANVSTAIGLNQQHAANQLALLRDRLQQISAIELQELTGQQAADRQDTVNQTNLARQRLQDQAAFDREEFRQGQILERSGIAGGIDISSMTHDQIASSLSELAKAEREAKSDADRFNARVDRMKFNLFAAETFGAGSGITFETLEDMDDDTIIEMFQQEQQRKADLAAATEALEIDPELIRLMAESNPEQAAAIVQGLMQDPRVSVEDKINASIAASLASGGGAGAADSLELGHKLIEDYIFRTRKASGVEDMLALAEGGDDQANKQLSDRVNTEIMRQMLPGSPLDRQIRRATNGEVGMAELFPTGSPEENLMGMLDDIQSSTIQDAVNINEQTFTEALRGDREATAELWFSRFRNRIEPLQSAGAQGQPQLEQAITGALNELQELANVIEDPNARHAFGPGVIPPELDREILQIILDRMIQEFNLPPELSGSLSFPDRSVDIRVGGR
jgi:hypothetical protein